MAETIEQKIFGKTHVIHFSYQKELFQVRNKTKLLELFKRLGVKRVYFGAIDRPKTTWKGLFSVSAFNKHLPTPNALNACYQFEFILEDIQGVCTPVRFTFFVAGFTDFGVHVKEMKM
jgi:hypothetical protein